VATIIHDTAVFGMALVMGVTVSSVISTRDAYRRASVSAAKARAMTAALILQRFLFTAREKEPHSDTHAPIQPGPNKFERKLAAAG
jgi:hypothetical protein